MTRIKCVENEPTLLEFLSGSRRNANIYDSGLTMYVRRGLWPEKRGEIEVANITADHPGCGSFTHFLDGIEPQMSVFVECVHNARLAAYLVRRGYIRVGRLDEEAPSFRKDVPASLAWETGMPDLDESREQMAGRGFAMIENHYFNLRRRLWHIRLWRSWRSFRGMGMTRWDALVSAWIMSR